MFPLGCLKIISGVDYLVGDQDVCRTGFGNFRWVSALHFSPTHPGPGLGLVTVTGHEGEFAGTKIEAGVTKTGCPCTFQLY